MVVEFAGSFELVAALKELGEELDDNRNHLKEIDKYVSGWHRIQYGVMTRITKVWPVGGNVALVAAVRWHKDQAVPTVRIRRVS